MINFNPTHRITTAGRTILVEAHPADDGERGEILYTREELDTCAPADWTLDPERGLLFQGAAGYPDGTTIERLATTTSE